MEDRRPSKLRKGGVRNFHVAKGKEVAATSCHEGKCD